MEVKIDREWSTFLKIFEKFFLHRPSGVLELRQRVRPDGAAPFSAPAERGTRTAAGGFALMGRLLSLHRLSGARELRQRVRPDRAAPFLHRKAGVRELPQACSPFPGREFSAEPQLGDSPSADGGNVPRPAAGAKRKGHLRFPFLFGLLPFPCFLIWRKFPICDRFEIGNGSRVTAACLSPPFRSSQTAYCYTCGLVSAGAT